MGAVLQKYSAPRDSYDVVQVLEPIEQVEIRTGPPQLPRVGKSNVNSQIQELFEHVLEAFDIKSQKNAFMDVKALMAQFNNDLEVEKISLKLTKHVFDHYDTNHNGYLELAEIEPFCTDLLCLFGEKADRERILNMEKELLKCVSKGENGLTFVNFWSSEVLKGKILGGVSEPFPRRNSTTERTLEKKELSNSGRAFAVQLLKSAKLKQDFKPVFEFFGVQESGNLLADITVLHQVFVKETDDDEVEMSKTQAKRISRFEKLLLQRLLRYVFEFYDKDNSGQIEKHELYYVMKDIITVMPPQYYIDELSENADAVHKITMRVMDEFLEEADENEDNMISYEELSHHLPMIFRRMIASS